MHELSYGFVLGYHGCSTSVANALLKGSGFEQSQNEYDWLGHGIYFWEANPKRGLSFAREALRRRGSRERPAVIGAVIDLGRCLDLTTEMGIEMLRSTYKFLELQHQNAGTSLPKNSGSGMKRNLDCAVFQHTHQVVAARKLPEFDSVRGVFIEDEPAYPGAGFSEKTHIQIAVRKPEMIKAVFRVPSHHLN